MKPYRNSERTKKWIRKAFIELIGEKKSIDKITINELASRADITKTTFYYHYEDIYAVAEEFENELINELNETLEEINANNPDDYSSYVKKVLSFIKENEDNYRLAARTSDFTIFAAKLKTIFSKRMATMDISCGFSQDKDKREVQVCFLVSACADVVIEYLKGNLSSSLDTVGNVVIETIDKLKKG